MAYTKTVWNNDGAPAMSANNLNKIEDAIEDLYDETSDIQDDINSLNNNKKDKTDIPYYAEINYSTTHQGLQGQLNLSGSPNHVNVTIVRGENSVDASAELYVGEKEYRLNSPNWSRTWIIKITTDFKVYISGGEIAKVLLTIDKVQVANLQ